MLENFRPLRCGLPYLISSAEVLRRLLLCPATLRVLRELLIPVSHDQIRTNAEYIRANRVYYQCIWTDSRLDPSVSPSVDSQAAGRFKLKAKISVRFSTGSSIDCRDAVRCNWETPSYLSFAADKNVGIVGVP
jgi:hypothetical protein